MAADGHGIADGGIGTCTQDRLPVCRNSRHAFVDSLCPCFVLLEALGAFEPDICAVDVKIIFTWVSSDLTFVGLFQLFVGGQSRLSLSNNPETQV